MLFYVQLQMKVDQMSKKFDWLFWSRVLIFFNKNDLFGKSQEQN